MATFNLPIISVSDIPSDNSDNGVIIVDARSGPGAYDRYRQSHLKGALHADLDRDLTAKPLDPAYGGRHPLPEVKLFASFLGALGITPFSRVIVYDDKDGANAAARFWWMLRALGHERVQVVDGGLDAITRSGLPMSAAEGQAVSTSAYPAQSWNLPTVSIEEVAKASADPGKLVIDVREGYRYRGESEPIDLVAGHIPGAVNTPYLDNLREGGGFRSPTELALQYNELLGGRDPKNVVVHCGSGVTACHSLLAMEQAGIKGPSLYVGSWSEWSRRDYPVALGE